ncbi:DsbA family protein [Corynebacterium lubricantis]|uniref:DsbA family protein n=1 Tax=Corynebacterium lubricantis TaxID=541095 RepID=UPI00035DDD35|nr:thioredoxin domain-containing protein [Corynebacterium lubricantis]
MSNKKVQNPNDKGNTAFLWTIIAVLVVAAIAVGLIVFNGRSEKAAAVAESMTDVNGVSLNYNKDDGIITLRAENADASVPSAELYEDFSCTYCAQLADETDAQMLQEIEGGNLEVDIRPLTFLDRGAEGNSTHVLAAVLATANSGDVNLYWNFREYMMANQQEIYNSWDGEDFANLAEQFGADSETLDAIRNGTYTEDAARIGQGNADTLNEHTGEVSSPRVLVDGKDVDVPQINQWIDAVVA